MAKKDTTISDGLIKRGPGARNLREGHYLVY